jgi:hypothetical protein
LVDPHGGTQCASRNIVWPPNVAAGVIRATGMILKRRASLMFPFFLDRR